MHENSDELNRWLSLAHHLLDLAQQETLPRFRAGTLSVTAKSGDSAGSALYDPVTVADKGAEQSIRDVLESKYPEFGLLGEEFGVLRPKAKYRWILDPIDGTRSFISGLPTWTTLLGLAEGGQPILGLIDQPFVGERWYGSSLGAYWTRTNVSACSGPIPLSCRPCASLEYATISATDPRPGVMFSELESHGFDQLARRARVARFSADAYAYMLVAMGCMDLVVEAGLQAYDIAAIIPIITAAGGVITDWAGHPIPLTEQWDGRVVAAGDPRTHEDALRAISQW